MLRTLICLAALWCLPVLAAPRVVTLAPHLTEMAYAAGMGQQLLAVSDYSDYPAEAHKLPVVASWQGINVERILSLKPDLVLASRESNPQRPVEMLHNLGIQILYIDNQTLTDIPANLEKLAQYSAHPQQATAAARGFRDNLRQLQTQYRALPEQKVFIQLGMHPLLTASSHTLQNQVVSLCHGHNIFADSAVPWPQVGREQIVQRKPAAIVIAGDQKLSATTKAFWQKLLPVPVLTLPEDEFSRPGPRILQAAEILCQQLQQLSQEKG
ncbi:MAG: vitamin B12 ABC transporter substrate-binding protein BtuF [Enterobacteriaceae bacterium]